MGRRRKQPSEPTAERRTAIAGRSELESVSSKAGKEEQTPTPETEQPSLSEQGLPPLILPVDSPLSAAEVEEERHKLGEVAVGISNRYDGRTKMFGAMGVEAAQDAITRVFEKLDKMLRAGDCKVGPGAKPYGEIAAKNAARKYRKSKDCSLVQRGEIKDNVAAPSKDSQEDRLETTQNAISHRDWLLKKGFFLTVAISIDGCAQQTVAQALGTSSATIKRRREAEAGGLGVEFPKINVDPAAALEPEAQVLQHRYQVISKGCVVTLFLEDYGLCTIERLKSFLDEIGIRTSIRRLTQRYERERRLLQERTG